jgi:hypothetical protein
MQIIIILLLITLVIVLNFLRLRKYRDSLEPNAEVIVGLINKLDEAEKDKEN